ncbi:DMT family transporter [Pseudoroseicyclus tamaricis]|uniref:DMT family transporter n=1 Tax=Pseudoroseicyclus tamaricis TaxID=2705421 RepID=A0A6B2JWE1_9RHOB|nr:DMT family transporter [Pseudoroseicyclus tamaricis]NDU99681.1 DMT family transporter [Pseudoroseicyclus tamaricis]
MTPLVAARPDRPTLGIALILLGTAAISVNDMLIKALSGGYPLHQMVFARSVLGLVFTLTLLQYEGGWRALKTRRPGLHLVRGLCLVISNMAFFAALAALPLAEATALFFVAPLFITLLSIPVLGEKVGPLRLSAVAVGFLGVLIMQRPWAGGEELHASRLVLALPLLAALTYAGTMVLTRRLGADMPAAAMAIYTQCIFLVVAVAFYLAAGDGRFAEGQTNESLLFLLRAWVWPEGRDLWLFVGLGFCSGLVGYCLAAAYRAADAATIAPFEYAGLPLAVFWGWAVFGTLPAPVTWVGMALILASGVFVYLRERRRGREVAARRPTRRY